ncbi:MAG TPA: TIR domain-containing protein, partial [Lacunisphaera sp.]
MSEPTKAVFLSYAREDAEVAQRIADALRAFGVEVWFDQNELRGGDTWDQKIRTQIKACALFMPIVSARTEERTEGYFRREWKFAVDRTHDMAGNRSFIVPVVTDDTKEGSANVPDEFMRYQWTRLPQGVPSPEFVAQVKRLLEAPKKSAGAAPKPSGATAPAAASAPRRARWTYGSAMAVVVAIATALYVGRKPAAPAATAVNPPATSAAPAVVAPVSDKSIAVLPFANMSEDKDSAFFTDGVHEDILTNLALVHDLKVISRTTIVRYRDSKKSAREIGEELGVAYILEGSVRRVGNKVRVTGQLINARTDEHVWAKAYDRDLTDIFAIQSALAQEIAGALQAAISPEAQKLIERRPTQNLVAYDAFLKGRETRNKARSGAPAPLKLAETYFQSAVDQDPTFAAAWGELAVVHALHVFWEIDHSPERLALAEAAIQRAVQLAPDSPDVIALVGTHAYYAHRDYAKATAQYERLARLKPNDPTVFGSLGLIQRRQGRWAESLTNLRRAAELDPGNPGYCRSLVQSLQLGRRWSELLAEQLRLITLVDDKILEEAALARLQYMATGSKKEGEA